MHHSKSALISRRVGVALLAAVSLGVCVAGAAARNVTLLDSKRTYIHTATADSSLNAIPIALAPLGYFPGDRIQIEAFGDFDNGPGGDEFKRMIGVFSSDDVLLSPSQLHRVPGALDAGVDFVTAPTYFGGEATDIPEDFLVASTDYPGGTICIVIPAGATHLFLAAHDSLYEDNSDPDGDFGYELSLLDACAADFDGNGSVNGGDLGVLLGAWGPLSVIGGPGDLDCDGDVDGADLGLLLAAWGPC